MSKKPKQKHGGKRAGAGRPPIFDGEFDTLCIGGWCEELFCKAWEAKKDTEIERGTKEVSKLWAIANAILIDDRKAWLESEAYQIYLEDVEDALQRDQGIEPSADVEILASRVMQVRPKRPKGVRKQIIAAVVIRVVHEYKKKVSPGFVENCWRELRATDKWLAAETKDYVPKHNAQSSNKAHDARHDIQWPDNEIKWPDNE